jgi:hypothetical protein
LDDKSKRKRFSTTEKEEEEKENCQTIEMNQKIQTPPKSPFSHLKSNDNNSPNYLPLKPSHSRQTIPFKSIGIRLLNGQCESIKMFEENENDNNYNFNEKNKNILILVSI